MRIIEPGHIYLPATLDGVVEAPLVFVKRVGGGYPGNEPPAHPGTNLQECWRAEIDRLKYLNRQIPCDENLLCQMHLRLAIVLLESRAARRHNRPVPGFVEEVETMPVCPHCLHIGCPGGGK